MLSAYPHFLKVLTMQPDLHNFLLRLAGTIVMTLAPVVFIAFVSMPASLHHRAGALPTMEAAPPQHMS
jgi:hypothetical protein